MSHEKIWNRFAEDLQAGRVSFVWADGLCRERHLVKLVCEHYDAELKALQERVRALESAQRGHLVLEKLDLKVRA